MDDSQHVLLAQTPCDAATDIAEWLEDMILGRDLTPQEDDQIHTKMTYWWAVAVAQRDALGRAYSLN